MMKSPKVSDKLFIYPTDTVWGIGASIDNENLHKKIAEIKRTRDDKPVSILYTSFTELLFDFDLPLSADRDEQWWKSFFAMETTLALSLKWSKRAIPKWITHGSPLVALRLLEVEDLRELAGIGPISTTSLNHHGHPPIQKEKEALEFKETFASSAQFIQARSLALSGRSSTIVHYQEEGSISFLREGGLINDVKNILGLPTT